MTEYIYLPFVAALVISLAWTVLFSVINKPSIRGLRNYGILISYVLCIIFFFITDWKRVVVTWACFGLGGGILYLLYEILQHFKSLDNSKMKSKISFGHLVFGFFAWPIMIPEALEYSLTEFGILKSARAITPEQGDK